MHSRSNHRCIQGQNELCTSPFFVLMLIICFNIVHSHNIRRILPLWSFMWPVPDPKLRSVALEVQGWADMALNPTKKFPFPWTVSLLLSRCLPAKFPALYWNSCHRWGHTVPRAVWCQHGSGSTMGEFLHLLSGQMVNPQLPMQQDRDGWSGQIDVSGLRMICLRAPRQRLVNC